MAGAAFIAEKGRKLVDLIRADRDHMVVLDEPYLVGTFRPTFAWRGHELPILPFENDKIVIDADRRLLVKVVDRPYCDGATGFPDRVAGIDLAPGYIPHDGMYASLEDMAADPAWREAGWTMDALRALADAVLGVMLQREEHKRWKGSLMSRFCYSAVRRLGGIWHRIAGTFAAVVLAMMLAGCSSCMDIPGDVFDPSDEDPVYHVIPDKGAP